jgi:hypothetical protein
VSRQFCYKSCAATAESKDHWQARQAGLSLSLCAFPSSTACRQPEAERPVRRSGHSSRSPPYLTAHQRRRTSEGHLAPVSRFEVPHPLLSSHFIFISRRLAVATVVFLKSCRIRLPSTFPGHSRRCPRHPCRTRAPTFSLLSSSPLCLSSRCSDLHTEDLVRTSCYTLNTSNQKTKLLCLFLLCGTVVINRKLWQVKVTDNSMSRKDYSGALVRSRSCVDSAVGKTKGEICGTSHHSRGF